MKLFIVNSIKLFTFCLLSCIVFLCISGDLLPRKVLLNLSYPLGSSGFLNTRIKELKKTKDIDLLIIGSSIAYRGYDIRIFNKYGFDAFNLGSSGQTPIQTELLLKRYLKKINPKIILFEVSPSQFMDDGVGSALDIIANDRNDSNSIKMASTINHLKVFITLIYGFYSDIFRRSENYIEAKRKGDELYINGGYVQKDLKCNSPVEEKDRNFKFNKYQIISFERILHMVNEMGVKAILIETPKPSYFYNSIKNRSEFEQKMNDLGDYHNFNYMKLDDSLNFYDHIHLNQNGVEIFNQELINKLLKSE